jgi:hypothetical protein
VNLDPVGVGVDVRTDGPLELLGRLLARVALQNSCLLLNHLAERPEGDALPLRKRAALPPGDQLRLLLDHVMQLVDEARLPIPGTPTRVTS